MVKAFIFTIKNTNDSIVTIIDIFIYMYTYDHVYIYIYYIYLIYSIHPLPWIASGEDLPSNNLSSNPPSNKGAKSSMTGPMPIIRVMTVRMVLHFHQNPKRKDSTNSIKLIASYLYSQPKKKRKNKKRAVFIVSTFG